MRITIDIQDSKATAFLNFIQSLDFVTINEEDNQLTDYTKRAIDIGLQQVEEGRTLSNDEVISEIRNRHPKYYK
jgi:hypothetical protein